MQKHTLLFTIILNLLSTAMWGEDFLVNYYHKGMIVHTQRVVQGSTIGSLPDLNLVSCNDEIPLFAGWITESDANKYETISTATPSFITADYVPTADINLYALFADGIDSGELVWQRVKSNSELKDNDQIIITAQNLNYAIGKTIKDKRLTAVEITKSNDKSTLTPNDNVQIFTLEKINDLLWGLQTENGYLGNTTTENTVTYYAAIKNWTSWGFLFNSTSYAVQIANNHTTYPPYLYYSENSKYFACRKTSIANLSIYKQTTGTTINYIACTTPDAVEYTITLHDGNNTSEIKCMSDASIAQPTATQTAKHWEFYGWATAPANGTTTTPETITFPYTPTDNIDLYAVYANTTADSLMMSNKTIPAGWQVNETRNYNTVISLFLSNNYIKTPTIENITKIEIEMQKNDGIADYKLYITTDTKELTEVVTNTYKIHSIDFQQPSTSFIKFTSSSSNTTKGIVIRNITIHHQPIYASVIEEDIRHTITFVSQSNNDQIKHYSISQSRGKSVKLPQNTFSNDLDFIGWNTLPDGSGTKYADEATIVNISNDITLYAQWGQIKTVESQETLNIEETTTINKLTIKSDVNGNTGEIKVANNAQLTITDEIVFEKEIDHLRYHFFSLPFDCSITDIEAINENKEKLTYAPNATDGDWVICRYDQTLAANNAGDTTTNAWVEILDKNYTLKANQGYIVGHFCNDEKVTIRFSSKEQLNISAPQDKTFDLGSDYQWYTTGEKLSANGWNLIGSPYYETITSGELTQFVTIPNTDGKTYTQCLYSEALKQGLITPFCNFFVQLNKNSAPTITTRTLDYTQLNDYTSNIITLTITSNTNKNDHTTIINHNECSAEYEIGHDLTKWIGYADRPQIYTIENEIPLAFNSQRINESTTLLLGVYTPTDGEYTFAANENCPDIYLTDKETNKTTNLAQSNYTTNLSQGTNNERFEICFQKATSTQLPFNNTKTEYFVENGTVYITNLLQNATIYIYDCTGKMIDITTSNHYTLPSKGLYHIIIIENDRKIDNFDVIY